MSNESPRTGLEIAIIGMAGRFPGAKNLKEFWQNLCQGVESISFFTAEELKEAGIDAEIIAHQAYVPANGYLEDIEYFDHEFFRYTPREAELMDPQFRLFHECVWEALEDAGYNPESYPGLIGIYAGAAFNPAWLARVMGKLSTGADQFEVRHLNNRDHLVTRVAYRLHLKGPAITVQSACSTSLVAVDQACRSLLTGQCDMALAGGVAVTNLQKAGYFYQEGMIMSADGHCRAFDVKASGTVGGNGVGLVVLKRLEEAIEDRDHIYAVIKGSASNNDGVRKIGYTAPSVEGQAEVIQSAQFMAEVEAESISYIETHGTGTKLGDPIEIEALKLAFNTEERNYCAIGAVKTNIGHLDTAAGVAGLIKTALALKHKLIPPMLHYTTPNQEIDFLNSPFYVNTKLRKWENPIYPLRAGVSSFGIGGTNAHVVLEEAPPMAVNKATDDWKILTLSARTRSALEKVTTNLVEQLKEATEVNLADVAYTLQVGRKEFDHRRVITVKNTAEAITVLTNLDSTKVFTDCVKTDNHSVVLMFSGQGSQYVEMGCELYENIPEFREEIDSAFEILGQLTGRDYRSALYLPKEETLRAKWLGKINETFYTQPIIFIFEYALAQLLIKWGVKPNAMIGHSIGEYTAACLAGVFSLKDALTLVALRGELMQEMPSGAMLSAAISESEVERFLNEELSLAAVNGPEMCVLAGSDTEITAVAAKLQALGREFTILKTSHAFHSWMMEPILERFRQVVAQIKRNQPKLPFISNVTGSWIKSEEARDPEYWVKHLRETVRFHQGLQVILTDPTVICIEVGPGQALSTFARQHPARSADHLMTNLVRHPKEITSDVCYLYERLGRLWLAGLKIDWQAFFAQQVRKRVPLPTYPFATQYFSVGDLGKDLAFQTTTEENRRYTRVELPDDYLAPRNQIEDKIVDIFGEILGIDKAGIYENFFELGGDSLRAVSVIGKIHREFDVKIPLSEFFQKPTPASLAAYLAKADKEIFSAIQPASVKTYYAMTSAQRRLYFIQQMETADVAYNMPLVVILHGELDQERFATSFRQLVQRHESLRTSFILVDDLPMQKIHPEVDFDIEYSTCSENLIRAQVQNFFRPFDLTKAPLFRVGLLQIEKDKYILMLDMNHIISDGTSISLLSKDFMDLYAAKELPELKLQYKDYSEWQNKQVVSVAIEAQGQYWLQEFAGNVPVLNLLTDFPRPEILSFDGEVVNLIIDEKLVLLMKELVKTEAVTIFIILLTTLNILLQKITGQEDIVIGTVTDGRGHTDLKNIVGLFVNTLALRNYPVPTKTFREFLREVADKTLKAFENQQYQFDDLVEKVVKNKVPGRNPLFDVMFVLQNMETPEIEIPGLKLEPYKYDEIRSKFDLTLFASELDGKITCAFVYNKNLFKRSTLELLSQRFVTLLSKALQNSQAKISDIDHRTLFEKEIAAVDELDFDF